MSLIGAAAITAGASLLGSAFSNSSNSNMNKKLFQFQKYQYEDQKRYNSMSSQISRMKEAGVNPSLALGAGQLGSEGNSVASPSPTPMTAPDFSAAGQIYMQGLQLRQQQPMVDAQVSKTNEEASATRIDNETRRAQNLALLSKLKADGNLTQEEYNRAKELTLQEQFNTAHQKENYMNQQSLVLSTASLNDAKTALANAQTDVEKQNFDKLQKEISWMDKEKQASIYTMYAHARAAIMQALASGKSAEAALLAGKASWRNSLKEYGHFFGPDKDGYSGGSFDRLGLEKMFKAEIASYQKNGYIMSSSSWNLGLNGYGFGGNVGGSSTKPVMPK